MAPDKTCTCANPNLPIPASPNLKGNGVNGIIMAGTATAGFKLSQKVPTAGGKVLCLCGCIISGGLAIAAKNISGHLIEGMGRNHLISNDQVMGFLKETFHLTGNNVLDLLNIIQLFQELQFLFIILI